MARTYGLISCEDAEEMRRFLRYLAADRDETQGSLVREAIQERFSAELQSFFERERSFKNNKRSSKNKGGKR